MSQQEAKKEIARAKEELLEAKAKPKELSAKLMDLSEVMKKIEAAPGRLQKASLDRIRAEAAAPQDQDREDN